MAYTPLRQEHGEPCLDCYDEDTRYLIRAGYALTSAAIDEYAVVGTSRCRHQTPARAGLPGSRAGRAPALLGNGAGAHHTPGPRPTLPAGRGPGTTHQIGA